MKLKSKLPLGEDCIECGGRGVVIESAGKYDCPVCDGSGLLKRMHRPPAFFDPAKCLQPEPWLCYPTVVSWLTGIRFGTLIELLGHDGSKIVNDEYEAPYNRESFSHPEMALALLRHGWASIPLAALIHHHGDKPSSGYPDFESLQEELADNHSIVVIVAKKGEGCHCYAGVPRDSLIVDPLTGKQIDQVPHSIEYFEVLERLK